MQGVDSLGAVLQVLLQQGPASLEELVFESTEVNNAAYLMHMTNLQVGVMLDGSKLTCKLVTD